MYHELVEDARFLDPTALPDTCPASLMAEPLDPLAKREFIFDDPNSADYVRPNDPKGMLLRLGEVYFRHRPEDLEAAQNRLLTLQERDSRLYDDIPRSTIVVATIETAAILKHTVELLAKQKGIEQDEIVLYGNMPANFSEEQKHEKSAVLDEVTTAFPHLRIRSINEEYDWGGSEDKPLMGKLRHDYMDIIALDGMQRGFEVDHPVITFDADTKLISQGSIAALSKVLRDPASNIAIAHLETSYLFDGPEDPMNDIRKLAILQEIRRRQWMRVQLGGAATRSGGRAGMPYDEEWGAAVALGPYIAAGGYNEHGKINENRVLRTRMVVVREEITELMRYAKPAIKQDVEYRPHYISSKVVRSSGRRQEDFLRHWVLLDSDAETEADYKARTERYVRNGLPYEMFSHSDSARLPVHETVQFRSEEQARRMIGAILLPNTVLTARGDVPMADPSPLLKRLGLPRVDQD